MSALATSEKNDRPFWIVNAVVSILALSLLAYLLLVRQGGDHRDPTALAFMPAVNAGFNALSAGSAPELRRSPYILDAAAFRQVVKGGALVSSGMPAFPEFDDATVEAIRHYLRMRSQQLGEANKGE